MAWTLCSASPSQRRATGNRCFHTHTSSRRSSERSPTEGRPNTEGFIPTWVADVDSIVPIRRFIDRAWPDLDYPVAVTPAAGKFGTTQAAISRMTRTTVAIRARHQPPVAKVCGYVSVAIASHHGYFNTDSAEYVRALKLKVAVIPSSAYSTVNTLAMLFSIAFYPSPRDVFATLVKEENRIVDKKTDNLKSCKAHTVVRVDPDGLIYHVSHPFQ